MEITQEFIHIFSTLVDPRVENHNLRHKMTDILIISFLAVVCGANDWTDVTEFGECKKEWLKDFLDLPNGIPSPITFRRFFSLLDPVQFEECFTNWVQSLDIEIKGDIIAIDGKASRASRNRGDRALHMLSAWSCNNGLVLGQCRVDRKTNEIKMLPELIKRLKIAGSIVTSDALNCQKSIAKDILEQEADYILAVKKNQKNLYNSIQDAFDYIESKDESTDINHFQSINGEHGRIETRKYSVLSAKYLFDIEDPWPGLKTIARVASTREIGDEISSQTRYFISSLPTIAEKIANGIRSHWHIENKLHWTLDVAFDDDRARSRVKNSGENFTILKHITLNLLKKSDLRKRSIKVKRKRAGWDHVYLANVLQNFLKPVN